MQSRTQLGLTAAVILLAGLQSAATPQVPPGFVGAFRWDIDDPRFGGFSSLEVSDDGLSFTTVSDRGTWTTGQITRDDQGAITGIKAGPILPLKDLSGRPLVGDRADAEGLAISPDGTAWISFEGTPHVWRYDRLDGPPRPLPLNMAFRAMPYNGSLEALAVDAAGRLFTLAEGRDETTDPQPVYRFDGTAWTVAFLLPRQAGWLPVGADFGPDGKLYILFRQFLGLGGFASRVQVMDLPDEGATAEPRTVLETPAGLYDNLEGLAVSRDASGATRLTMISDDNFAFYLRTELVEFRLPD